MLWQHTGMAAVQGNDAHSWRAKSEQLCKAGTSVWSRSLFLKTWDLWTTERCCNREWCPATCPGHAAMRWPWWDTWIQKLYSHFGAQAQTCGPKPIGLHMWVSPAGVGRWRKMAARMPFVLMGLTCCMRNASMRERLVKYFILYSRFLEMFIWDSICVSEITVSWVNWLCTVPPNYTHLCHSLAHSTLEILSCL